MHLMQDIKKERSTNPLIWFSLTIESERSIKSISLSQPFALRLHITNKRIADGVIENPSKTAMDNILRCILGEADEHPVAMVQQMLVEKSHS